ncbi:MAG TPA: NAD(P)H-dependent oxidoreductase subunit E [Nitrospirae bacterium]|nr:NAD(P)H-dependent oxidoreductase subunit E [Nitrospirota bacterium]
MRRTSGEGMIDEHARKTIEGFIKKFPCGDSALVPSLCLIQKENGYISGSDMEYLSEILNLPEARIFSAASFYSMLHLSPRGKYHIQVCTNISCSILEKETLFDYISKKLSITDGESTQDGLFSLEAVECLGACGYAPVMMINADHYENLDFNRMDKIIDLIREYENPAEK